MCFRGWKQRGWKVWLQVSLLGYVIYKNNIVDVSTRQHSDKRFGWLRPNYAQPWQQELRDTPNIYEHRRNLPCSTCITYTRVCWIYLWRGKIWTRLMPTCKQASSLPFACKQTHTKQQEELRQVEPTPQWDLLNISLCFYWPVRSVGGVQCVCAHVCVHTVSVSPYVQIWTVYICAAYSCFYIFVFLCSQVFMWVFGWAWQPVVLMGCQGNAQRRACDQLQSIHQGSMMRQRTGGSHDDFSRVVSLLLVKRKNVFQRSWITSKQLCFLKQKQELKDAKTFNKTKYLLNFDTLLT